MYGLGANALNEEAVLNVFKYKGRPLTDPLIVHIDSRGAARRLVKLEKKKVEDVFVVLTDAFWPGPLTVVLEASEVVPSMITARTGWVGVRVPAHPLAIRLLSAARVPIAAPSANRFGHVSPTTAAHVFADLGMHPIAIMDGEGTGKSGVLNSTPATTASCEIGIESTVLKICQETDSSPVRIDVFRKGGVGISALARALTQKGYTIITPAIDLETISVAENIVLINVIERHAKVEVPAPVCKSNLGPNEGAIPVAKDDKAFANPGSTDLRLEAMDVGEVAPGQLLTHYAPDVPAYLITSFNNESTMAGEVITAPGGLDALQDTVVLDFGGIAKRWLQQVELQVQKPQSFLAYLDLSPSGQPKEASSNLFASLRWAEKVDKAKLILLLDPRLYRQSMDSSQKEIVIGTNTKHCEDSVDVMEAIRDRMFRAASGKEVSIQLP